ncbi:MAG TPA: DUF134 domain-containing protein [Bacteroidales bacterium]|nr:DUF134 domain-containing protein [Bacteroidales bacterium]HPS26733.1 DUF134 domain-containing protein [Bacteroidales bacterium]HQI69950.1 DUF134 domain-containing protein [Bacteroidales bacterium]
MSPRIKIIRKVLNPPVIKGFKPYGPDTDKLKQEPVLLLYEEYEALRLCDYDLLNHHMASVAMGVSRPTFTRIYAHARQKIAQAFVEGTQISIEGGKVYFDSDWYCCESCGCYFNNPERETGVEECPLCGSGKISRFDYDSAGNNDDYGQCSDLCYCPQCGFEKEHQRGVQCNQEVCPHCKGELRRKRNINNW